MVSTGIFGGENRREGLAAFGAFTRCRGSCHFGKADTETHVLIKGMAGLSSFGFQGFSFGVDDSNSDNSQRLTLGFHRLTFTKGFFWGGL